MHRTLIIARMDPADAPGVADAFARSDRGDLPGMLGVTERRLYTFHGLYVHLVETAAPLAEQVGKVRDHPEFVGISAALDDYVKAYDPETWRGPSDAMAREFYSWSAPRPDGGAA